jgi:urate oxidase
MLRIARRGDRHDPRDLNVAVRLEGAYDAAFLEGRQDGVIPGETLKNIVHAGARAHGASEIEELGLALSRQIVERQPRLSRVRVEIAEKRWLRLEAGGKPQAQTFLAGTDEQRLAIVTTNGQQTSVVAGVSGLTVMRTSGFTSGTLATNDADGVYDGEQPLVVGTLSARWTYTTGDVTFGVYRQGVRAAVLDTFAWHRSQSVHHALHAVANVVLSTYEEIADVTLAFHERPYRPADLFAAGAENPNELFVVVDEPIGVVEVTVERNR